MKLVYPAMNGLFIDGYYLQYDELYNGNDLYLLTDVFAPKSISLWPID